MARRGRKFKLDQKRQPNGKIREKAVAPNPTIIARRLAAGKDERAELDNPLSLLFHRGAFGSKPDAQGKTEDDGHDLFDAGSQFGALYWRLHGKPFARSIGGVHGQDSLDPVRALQDERRYKQIIHALDRLGRNTRSIAIDCCAHLKMPSERHLERLKRGLRVILDVGRPRISDAERERAIREIAA